MSIACACCIFVYKYSRCVCIKGGRVSVWMLCVGVRMSIVCACCMFVYTYCMCVCIKGGCMNVVCVGMNLHVCVHEGWMCGCIHIE